MGYGNRWTAWRNVNGAFTCGVGFGPDPAYGQAKECICMGTDAPTEEEFPVCPDGYSEKSGDIPGWGQIGKRSAPNVIECGKLCDGASGCWSFEYSTTEKFCNLNRDANPRVGAYKDYAFCSKQAEVTTCPDGYEESSGDIPGFGQLGGKIGASTVEECAGRCNSNAQCNSFEFSPTERLCNLNRDANPRGGPYKDYAFCSKSADVAPPPPPKAKPRPVVPVPTPAPATTTEQPDKVTCDLCAVSGGTYDASGHKNCPKWASFPPGDKCTKYQNMKRTSKKCCGNKKQKKEKTECKVCVAGVFNPDGLDGKCAGYTKAQGGRCTKNQNSERIQARCCN